ncbi:MAG: hypothetical protein KGI29_07020 [Pseudomonadota bacterium]|nr:hypothetical protein [Pseudomonadota bacterium]MDE3038623.1 hypothetical protein [Pseudomonadota bacterium]
MSDGPAGGISEADRLSMQRQSTSETDKANEEYIFQLPFDALNRAAGTAARLLGAIPFIGSLLSAMIPTNAGEVSVFASLNRESAFDKSINQGKGGLQGGAVYNAVAAPLVKNSAITDQTGGAGGGGSGGSQGFESYAASSGMGEMFIAAGGGNHFQVQDMPMASLGTLSPPTFGGAATSRGEGFGMV